MFLKFAILNALAVGTGAAAIFYLMNKKPNSLCTKYAKVHKENSQSTDGK